MNQPPTPLGIAGGDDYDPDSMPVTKARELITRFLAPVTDTESLELRSALGRILAADIVSPINVPAHDNSAMDGYAIRAADLSNAGETTLKRIGASFAGKPYTGAVQRGECVRIMTGGVVPTGADTIVMQEHARANGDNVTVGLGNKPGQHVRLTGSDLKQGQAALTRGTALRPAETGLLASLGIAEVPVYRKLKVAFFSTGDEVRPLGTTLAAGQLYDSNSYTLHGMLTRMGYEALHMGIVPDDPVQIERAFAAAAESADVIISSGGVSVGEADFIRDILQRMGEVVFWKIAMKPGRPLAYGRIGKAHFFGLPGNPVSAMVTFYQFVREALMRLSGRSPIPLLPSFKVTCTSSIKKAPGRVEFQRGVLEPDGNGSFAVRITGDQSSGILRSMSEANCFVILPVDQGNVAPGTQVEVQIMEGVV